MYFEFVIFFLLLATGYCCKRFGIFGDAAINNINRFIILIAYPALILVRTSSLDMTHRIFLNFLLMIALSVALLLVYAGYAYVYAKKRRFPSEEAPAAELAMICPNNGFMGFPIADTFFGDMGLLYMVASNVALNTFFFTYGVTALMRGRGEAGEPFLRKLKNIALLVVNPKVSAAIVGIVFCVNHIVIPDFLEQFLQQVGNCATPLAMISIGTIIAGGFGAASLKNSVLVEAVIGKVLIIPLFTFAIVWFLPIDPMVKLILIVASTLPTATTIPILGEQYRRGKELAGTILVVSTLISMGTIPLGIWLLGLTGLPG
ncbi:MAG: AEC family transporter [Clostridiales bacterium]|nr:AEC family transporter [Clostridiales bacterium]